MKNKLSFLWLMIIFLSCSDLKEECGESNVSVIVNELQLYIDSSAYYYMKAIEEMENGIEKSLIEKRHAGNIVFFHSKLSSVFDSITNEYINNNISQSQYDNIRNSIFLDSVVKRSERLSQLGLDVELE